MQGGNCRNEVYRDCMKNHAINLGTYATDGCREFTGDANSPGGLHCVACGCHRSFHRKVSYGIAGRGGGAPEVMMDLTEYSGGSCYPSEQNSKKQKLTAEQEEKMMAFAEMLVWKVERKDMEAEIERFCRGIGVSMLDFKLWMHNHKRSSTSSVSPGNASSLTQ